MAAAAQPVPQQGAPTGAPSPAGGGGALLQILDGITKLALMLKQIFPAATEMADEIANQINMVKTKANATSSPAQAPAPPI
jgi:hypothetical protein